MHFMSITHILLILYSIALLWVDGSNVAKSWQEFRSVVMEAAEGVCGRKKCRNDKQRTRWWNKEVETAVRKQKIAYKRWLQVKT